MFYGLVAFATLQKQGKASFEAADKNIESGKASFGFNSVGARKTPNHFKPTISNQTNSKCSNHFKLN